MNQARQKMHWYCHLSLKSLVSTQAYVTTREQLQHPLSSLEHTAALQIKTVWNPNDLSELH